ncbi:MAG: hypothetical protein RIS76_1119 [Verrucomicrobiota bacterium]
MSLDARFNSVVLREMPIRPQWIGLIILGLQPSLWFAAGAQDVADVSLYRSAYYQQISNAEPEPSTPADGNSPFTAMSVMEMSEAFLSDPENLDWVRSVTLQRPTGPLMGMTFIDSFAGFVAFDTFTSAAALESAYREGVYRFTLSSFLTGDETYNLGLPDRSLLPPPRVLNFTAAQDLDAAQPFTLRWEPRSTLQEFIELEVFDVETGERVYDAGILDGPLDSLTIPPDSLLPGKTYHAELIVTRIDANDFDSVPSRYASTGVLTALPMRTQSGAGGSLAITALSLDADGSVRCTITCQAGVQLELQRSTGLGSEWQTVQSTIPESSPVTVVLPTGSLGDLSFLRAVQ